MSENHEIVPLTHPPRVSVRVPGSKSITNRALVLAALSRSTCELRGALQSEDTEVMVSALRALGFEIRADWNEARIAVSPSRTAEVIPVREANLFVANSGTSMRFLTALVSLGHGRFRLDGVPRMRERPIGDLLAALQQMGVRAYSENGNDCPPVIVESNGMRGGRVDLQSGISSQFLSGLLLAAPRAKNDLTIHWHGPRISWPYVNVTTETMRQFGIDVTPTVSSSFLVRAPQSYEKPQYLIEPDASAASYFWAAAAITGGSVRVEDLTVNSLQGDVQFVEMLEEMGCTLERDAAGITVHGDMLRGIDVDMNAISDTVMTLAAVACFAEGPTTIRNVAHVRHKETDRLAALTAELRRVGANVEEFADGLTITPRRLHGAAIETYNDHRMAMSMALIGLRVPGIVIKNPGCVAKTYPHFFTDLERLRAPAREDLP